MSELSREQVETLAEVIQERDLYASGRPEEIAAGIAPTVAAMLAEAREEVARDVAAIPAPGPFDYLADWAQYRSLVIQALDRHVPSAVREGGTERSGASGGSAEPPGPSDGRTGPLRRQRCRCGWEAGHTDARRDGRLCGEPDPTCNAALGDMRCQLRRGHDGDHEDFSGLIQEKRA
jgi:hypothetical protein